MKNVQCLPLQVIFFAASKWQLNMWQNVFKGFNLWHWACDQTNILQNDRLGHVGGLSAIIHGSFIRLQLISHFLWHFILLNGIYLSLAQKEVFLKISWPAWYPQPWFCWWNNHLPLMSYIFSHITCSGDRAHNICTEKVFIWPVCLIGRGWGWKKRGAGKEGKRYSKATEVCHLMIRSVSFFIWWSEVFLFLFDDQKCFFYYQTGQKKKGMSE